LSHCWAREIVNIVSQKDVQSSMLKAQLELALILDHSGLDLLLLDRKQCFYYYLDYTGSTTSIKIQKKEDYG
jgi:hypothetical protein